MAWIWSASFCCFLRYLKVPVTNGTFFILISTNLKSAVDDSRQATNFSWLPIVTPQTGHNSNHLLEQFKILNALAIG